MDPCSPLTVLDPIFSMFLTPCPCLHVRQAYDRSLPLRPLDCDDHLILAAQALNVLNTYDKGFTHTQAYWLCPLQLTMEPDNDTGEPRSVRQASPSPLPTRHVSSDQSRNIKRPIVRSRVACGTICHPS